MVDRVSIFRVVRCPKCFKLLTEFTDIPVYKCGACSTVLHAKGYNVTGKSVTSRSGSRSINAPLNCSEQSILSSSSLCSSPSSNNEGILHEKGLLSITHADRDKTSPLQLQSKQDENIDKNMNFLHKDEENGNQLKPDKLSFDNSKSQDQLKSSLNPLSFSPTLEGNVATVLKSQTSRSSYAYDASISCIDASTHHILNKNHLMSMRTFRLQRPPKLVSNISKEGEEDNVQAEHQSNKILLKSRTNSNEIADEGNACANRKPHSLRYNLPAHRQSTSVESLPSSSPVELEKKQASHLRGPTFFLDALRSQKQDRIEPSSNMSDIRNLHIGHHQCSSHPSPSFCCSKCSSCVYHIHHSSVIEEVEKLKMKDKRLQARRQCRPISNGAPFVTCSQCFELLRLPMDFFISKRGSNKLQCGACSKILVLQFPAKDCSISCNFADAKSCPQVLRSSGSAGNASLKPGSSVQVRRNCEQELLPPLHQLMGYFSATEVLYQVTDVDEGYESSEPAMPDSYRCYEEDRRKKLLLQYSKDEAYFGSVEVEEEDDSPKILNKREQSHLHSMMNGVKRIETWGSKALG